uniref:Lysosomal acid phosphatase n=1 Tax=Panagrolaimus superbus TaxID=310955 RepID=A0A914Z5F7_9BILA
MNIYGAQELEHADTTTLRLVHVIWRHGDRTPSILLPTDPTNGINSWPLGLGELTKKGIQQEFKLGKFLRKRYDGFLSQDYSPFEVYVRSSDYNRTLASGQAVLSGIFPIHGEELWVPIPVHTVPKPLDSLLYDRVLCPIADAERQMIYSSNPEILKISKKNENMLRFLAEKSGATKIPLPLREIWFIFDPLFAISCHNESHKLPDWVNSTVQKEIWRLYDISSNFMYHTDLLKRLRGGPLLKDILNRMQSRISGILDKRLKFYAFSGHDTSISALLNAFGVAINVFPHYSTALFVELHEIGNEFVVKLFYKSQTDSSFVEPLEIPGCEKSCTIEKLFALRKHVIPDDWEVECGLKHWYSFTSEFYLLIICFLSLLCAILVGCLLNTKMVHKRRRNAFELKSTPSGAHLLTGDDEDIDAGL